MKNFNIKTLCVALVALGALSSCTKEDDTNLPPIVPAIYFEDFQTAVANTPFDFEGWTNFAQVGTKKWIENAYQGNGYAEFTPFNSGQASNVAWIVTPGINIDGAIKKRLTFDVAQHHVTDLVNNKLEVFISTDYDGTNVTDATWTQVSFTNPLPGSTNNYDFFKAGAINLANYSGTIYVGFKATGGTATAISGAYMIDNVKIF